MRSLNALAAWTSRRAYYSARGNSGARPVRSELFAIAISSLLFRPLPRRAALNPWATLAASPSDSPSASGLGPCNHIVIAVVQCTDWGASNLLNELAPVRLSNDSERYQVRFHSSTLLPDPLYLLTPF